MKKFQDSSNYISHLCRLASIMNSSTRDPFTLSTHKILSDRKNKTKLRQRFGERQTKWRQQKQNIRIAESIITKPGVLNFQTTEQHFQKHLRIRKLRTKFPTHRGGKNLQRQKEIVIKDVIWKNQVRCKEEVLEVEGCGEGVVRGNRGQLGERVMVMGLGESVEFGISGGGKKGKVVIRDSSIVPIMSRGKGIGTAIVKIDYK